MFANDFNDCATVASRCREEGQHAYHCTSWPQPNPYPAGSDEARWWQEGVEIAHAAESE